MSNGHVDKAQEMHCQSKRYYVYVSPLKRYLTLRRPGPSPSASSRDSTIPPTSSLRMKDGKEEARAKDLFPDLLLLVSVIILRDHLWASTWLVSMGRSCRSCISSTRRGEAVEGCAAVVCCLETRSIYGV